jgi:uncharacterized protein YfaS (alpha-2-macroglobulin family)
LPASLLAVPAELKVVQAGPVGEIAKLEEAREIRVVFAEPMVALGRIPDVVSATFFRIRPEIPGRFRWSGTNTLIFSPTDPGKLPYATRFDVTLDETTTSVAGRRLAKPYTFSFTTPTLRLLRTGWYRIGKRYDAPVILALRFNQPVNRETLAPHLRFDFVPHDLVAPVLPPEGLEKLKVVDPQAVGDFEAKRARAQQAASSREAVSVSAAADWDRQSYPAGADLLVFQTDRVPPPEGWIRVSLDAGAPGLQGRATPDKPQEHVVKLERAFFVEGFRCRTACDPDNHNPLRLRSSVRPKALRRVLKVTDVTDAAPGTIIAPRKRAGTTPGEEAPALEEDRPYDHTSEMTLEDAGYSLRPARTYEVVVDRALTAQDGQVLGYSWVGNVENWHRSAFSSFGGGHGVWESSSGPRLPFYARNLQSVTQWLMPLKLDELMPTVRRLQEKSFASTPEGPGVSRRLRPSPDTMQSVGLDLAPLLPTGTGLVWAALQDGTPIPRSRPVRPDARPRSSIVQVTGLGLSVKDSPQNTLVFVTRLADAIPVEGARVAIRDLDNKVRWTGITGPDGSVLAPALALRDPERSWEFRFLVTAEKDGDTAYVGSDWNEGIEPWSFGSHFDLGEAKPLLRGALFSDRGVYKLGEEVHLKAILRSDNARGIALLAAGTKVDLSLKDSQGDERDRRTVPLGEWSSAEWTLTLPAEAPLGRYQVTARVEGQEREAVGGFLVAAYRRPDFRVDANVAGESTLAGVGLKGVVEGRYLFGAPMSGKAVRWTYSKAPLYDVPAAVSERFAGERWVLVNEEDRQRPSPETLQTKEETLDRQGRLILNLASDLRAGRPYLYTLEGDVTDVSRQTIAGRASFRVDPAPWYVGLKRPAFFADTQTGLDTEVVAADLTGRPAAAVAVHVSLTRVQWHSVRRAEGGGFYTWETERQEVPAGSWDLTSAVAPVPLHVPLGEGGYYLLRAAASDAEGRSTTAATGFYALGPGYTAWARHDHNRIDLVPEKKTYRPGETARVMIQSPWEKATALLTTEREGVRTTRPFELNSTQQTVSVPISEDDVPNLFVSVLLVKGRTGVYRDQDTSDPGKPAFRLGYVELRVEDAAKRLGVSLKTDRAEYRPAGRAQVEVTLRDHRGRPAPAEVTLWAVDYGVLSLTGYRTPDVLGSVWVEKALQVMNEDSRQNIISRRSLTPKGADEGGGGGFEGGPSTEIRKDFRVLAFWLGSVPTDASGRAVAEVVLPESLTTYRIMAVAADRSSRFGWAQQEIRTSKPVLLKPAFPRFLARGDTALFGAVVHSQLKEKGTGIVTLRSLDPAVLEPMGEARRTVAMAPGSATEVRFTVKAKAVGRGRLQMAVTLLGETDAFEDAVPVEVLSSPAVVAAYGQAKPEAHETVELPPGVVSGYGGLHVDLSSTALVGLGEGARYLVEYPYGCAEQRSSAALALLLAADLGDAFRLPGLDPVRLKGVARDTLKDLEGFQCAENGGFAFWKGGCHSVTPYLTSYVVHVLQRGSKMGYPVNPAVMEKAYAYLEQSLAGDKPTNEGWWPAYTAGQAFAVKVLAEGGRNADSHFNRIYAYLDRMPVFALSYLLDAQAARGEHGPREAELVRRIKNAVLPEAGMAHVEELSDPYLLWFWNSNVRSTAVVLGTLVRAWPDDSVAPALARWLVRARTNGRWGNTQENGVALEALVDYYKKHEAEVPDFTAVVKLGARELATDVFSGRSSEARPHDLPMTDLLGRGREGERLDLAFARKGSGTLHYVARLKYAVDAPSLAGMDQGFLVERRYGPVKGNDNASPLTRFQAGDLVQVTLTFRLPKERRFVAVTDPLPAGFEPVESWFATTAADLARDQEDAESRPGGWERWWQNGGFDHVERHDDRVLLFATRLAEGEHIFSYVVRATTAGTFRTAPARAEEMYEPEVFGRTASAVIEVRP